MYFIYEDTLHGYTGYIRKYYVLIYYILYTNILTCVAGRRCGVEAKLGGCARRACPARLAQRVPNGSACVQLPLVHGGCSVQWRGHGGKTRSLLALLVQKYEY